MGQAETFSIRQLIELTGLSEFTIRGWENRYSAFHPRRSETGRREYSKSDVERALLLRELLKRGHKIGKIAQLSNPKLKSLFEQTEAVSQEPLGEVCSETVTKALEWMALQKWAELEALIKSVRSKRASDLIHDFFLPALQALATKVDEGVVSISQEHVFSSFLKERIYSALSELEEKKRPVSAHKKHRFVLATPEGDHHEIGLLLAHLLIRSHGFTSLYLGPHTPAQDLSETALRFDASHLLIVSTVSKKGGARQELLSFVSDVQKKIGSRPQILVAGSQAPLMAQDDQSSMAVLPSFQVLEGFLKKLEGDDD